MRKIKPFWQTAIMFCIVMMLAVNVFAQTATPPAIGDGSESNPYQIATLENLYWLTQSDTVWNKHYIQIADIDASTCTSWDRGAGFTPIGNTTTAFIGSYNGKGNVIESIYINRPDDTYIGLFGILSFGVHIDSLGLTNIDMKGAQYIGGIAGQLNEGQITNCYTTGTCGKIGYNLQDIFLGGLVGHNKSKIEFCYSDVDVEGIYIVGGLVSPGRIVGGLVGANEGGGVITNSYSAGDVSGSRKIGGFVGNNSGSIQFCYSRSKVSASSIYLGGFVGNYDSGSTTSCFWDIETSGQLRGYDGVGLTTVEMKDSTSYLEAGWDFMNETYNGTVDIWGLNRSENGGYPFLQWQGYANTGIPECQAPFLSVNGITCVDISLNSITLESYTEAGYGTVGYSIYINSEDSWNVPADGTEPIADTSWQNNGQQCFYFGTSNNPNVTVTGLLENTKYYFKVYAYNDCEGTETYEQNGTTISVNTYISILSPIGDGSESNPYEIATLGNLLWLMESDTVWDKYFIQTTDINAANTISWDDCEGFTPIGNPTIKFTGSYNGQGNTIDSLFINRPGNSHVGFIGGLGSGAFIDNLGLTNINFTGYDNIGGIVTNNDGTISNCYTTGKITTPKNGTVNTGGLVGYNLKTINNCYSYVDINATNGERVGGLVGTNYDTNANVNYCYSTGKVVSSAYYVGGLVGRNISGNINYSFWDTETSGQTTSYGGVGLTTSEMQDSTNYLNDGWDFMDETYNGANDYWGFNKNENNGYPFLYWQGFTNNIVCQAPSSGSEIIFGDIWNVSVCIERLINSGYGVAGYAVYMNTEDNWIAPDDGTEPTANITWQNNGQQCIYFDNSSSPNIVVTGLEESTNYYFKVYAFSDCNGVEMYEQTGTVISRVLGKAPTGEGSESNPFIISKLENLVWLMYSDTEWDKYYIQNANIDASKSTDWDYEKGFTPIGNSAIPFTGSYDGKGFSIDQLTIDRSADSLIGLFGYVEYDASIKNIGLTNMNIKGGRYVGGIAGLNYGGELKNCYTTGICSGNASNLYWGAVGGLIGYNLGAIKYCYSDADVSCSYDVIGGLAGVNDGFISCSYSSGKVNGNNYVGGLAGINYYILYHSYSRSIVNGFNYTGGLVGDGDEFYVLSSFWDTESSGQSTSYGGVGLGTNYMQKPDDYVHATWDFMNETINGTADIWGLNANENDGYPFLQWQGFTNTETVSTGINSIDENNIIIYPNPVSDILNIQFNDENIKLLIITDISGKTIIEKIMTLGTEYVDMSSFKSGVYLINIFKDKEEIYTSKIIKK